MLSDQPASSLKPLCYEHHSELNLVHSVSGNGKTPHQELEYACQVSDCPVRYSGAQGYFLASLDSGSFEEEAPPRLRCPHDDAPLYLAELRPQERSFRLWRCPLCEAAFTSGQVFAAAI